MSSVGFFKCKKRDPKLKKMAKIGTLDGHYTKSISRNSNPKYSKFAHSSKVYLLLKLLSYISKYFCSA